MRKRILIIRQDRIGDAVLATALPREIRKRWPDSYVGMLVRGYTRPLFEHNPHVDVILTDDHTPATRQETFWPMVRELRRHRFTHALMLLPEARINYMTFCAGIPLRFGHGVILFHALTLVRPVMTRKFRKGRHEAEYSMDLARAMGVATENVTPEIHLTAAEREATAAAAARWRFDGSAGKVVGIHTTSGASAPNWTPEVWRELIDELVAVPDLRVVVTDNQVPAAVTGLPGVLYPNVGVDLRRALGHLAGLDLLVSASTGPMHMAAALRVPTLSLFCPEPACEPALWGPLGNRAEFVMPEPGYCQRSCPGDPHICDYAGSAEVRPARVALLIQAQLLRPSGSS